MGGCVMGGMLRSRARTNRIRGSRPQTEPPRERLDSITAILGPRGGCNSQANAQKQPQHF